MLLPGIFAQEPVSAMCIPGAVFEVHNSTDTAVDTDNTALRDCDTATTCRLRLHADMFAQHFVEYYQRAVNSQPVEATRSKQDEKAVQLNLSPDGSELFLSPSRSCYAGVATAQWALYYGLVSTGCCVTLLQLLRRVRFTSVGYPDLPWRSALCPLSAGCSCPPHACPL